MAVAATTITAVFKNQRQSAKGPFTSYDVKAGGRKYQTTKDDLGQKAEQLKGQPVVISYTEVQRGEYTNYNITDIVPAEAETGHVTQGKASQDEFRRSKEEMRRTEALGVAATLAATLEVSDVQQLFDLSDALLPYLESGQQVPEEEPQY